MIVKIDRSFEKDTDKIKDKKLLLRIASCIDTVINSKDITRINNLKKIKGFHNYYRIRLGEYRIGIYFTDNSIIFERFLHRKDIYKFFP